MRKHQLTLVGILVGMMCAWFGSATITIVIMLISYREMMLKSGLFVGIWFFLFGVICSFIPGALGGVYLARWLEASEHKPGVVKLRGLLVGGVAGLISFLIGIAIFTIALNGSLYTPAVLPLIALVMLVSSFMGKYGVNILSKRLRTNTTTI